MNNPNPLKSHYTNNPNTNWLHFLYTHCSNTFEIWLSHSLSFCKTDPWTVSSTQSPVFMCALWLHWTVSGSVEKQDFLFDAQESAQLFKIKPSYLIQLASFTLPQLVPGISVFVCLCVWVWLTALISFINYARQACDGPVAAVLYQTVKATVTDECFSECSSGLNWCILLH